MAYKTGSTNPYFEDIQSETRMPFPFVAGGIGLLLAVLFPGGLTGGQGFLIGFIIGVSAPLVIGVVSIAAKARDIRLTREIEEAISKRPTVADNSPWEGAKHERQRGFTLGKTAE